MSQQTSLVVPRYPVHVVSEHWPSISNDIVIERWQDDPRVNLIKDAMRLKRYQVRSSQQRGRMRFVVNSTQNNLLLFVGLWPEDQKHMMSLHETGLLFFEERETTVFHHE